MSDVSNRFRPTPDRLAPELTEREQIVLLARALWHEGYDDHLAGHITWRQDDGTLLATPFGLTWDEVCAGDVMRIDRDGRVLDGRWTVTPAIALDLAFHRFRGDAAVCVHNHPRWATLWADMRRVPPVYDQTGGLVAGEVAMYDDYEGAVNHQENAEAAVEALGPARMALLANHGVLVVGDTPRQALLRCITLEWRCRQAWHLEAVRAGVPLRDEVVARLGAAVERTSFTGLWEAMARRALRRGPGILDGDVLEEGTP